MEALPTDKKMCLKILLLTFFPVGTLPVNVTLAISGCVVNKVPVSPCP